MLVVRTGLRQPIAILPKIKFLPFFCESISKQFFSTRNFLPFDNSKKLFFVWRISFFQTSMGFFLSVGLVRCTSKYKKFLLVKVRVRFFISCLGLESSLGRLNQQSPKVMRNFFILHLVSSHPRV